MESLALGFVRLVIYTCRFAWNGLKTFGSGKWPRVEGTVTADPVRVNGFGGSKVEFPYSYRVEGELYTRLHEEPCFPSESEYMERFAKGRRFVVRVKPSASEVSLVREGDQADGIQKRLEEIDDLHKRETTRN